MEQETRWEIDPAHTYANGIREDMSIDRSLHSLFGASKVAADVLVQEYGRYFGMQTACFRGGTPDRPEPLGRRAARVPRLPDAVRDDRHALHGVRLQGQAGPRHHPQPRPDPAPSTSSSARRGSAEVYNIGGGPVQQLLGARGDRRCARRSPARKLEWTYREQNRVGDHIWWIGDNGRFEAHYPDWKLEYDVRGILKEIHEANAERWTRTRVSAES